MKSERLNEKSNGERGSLDVMISEMKNVFLRTSNAEWIDYEKLPRSN